MFYSDSTRDRPSIQHPKRTVTETILLVHVKLKANGVYIVATTKHMYLGLLEDGGISIRGPIKDREPHRPG